MMFASTAFLAILMGIVEGLTEFLPVSSTGHLLLADEILGFQGPAGHVFEIVIQLGAILAVCWVYRARLLHAVTGVATDRTARRFILNVIVAFLPAAVVGATAYKYIKGYLFSPWVVAVSLVLGGVAILAIERNLPRTRVADVDEIRVGTAFKIGCCQILAMIPGVSRAGATIMGALLLGVDRKPATEFSFFLAIPTMLAATVFDLYKNRGDLDPQGLGIIAIGFVTSFIFALIVVRTMVGFVSRHGFAPFAWYRIALGLLALALLALGLHGAA